MDPGAPVPFTILSGWLGAGKTSALNRMLGARHGRRVAVLVNELGRIAIDTRLILSRGSDVLELAGGCVCCKVDLKNDLWDGIADIVARSAPDHLVLETTGIAEPPAILEGLTRVEASVRARIRAAGVICVIDGEAAPTTLARRDEARIQLETADRVLLSKLDVAAAAAAAASLAAVLEVNPAAERASFPRSEEGDLALAQWMLESRAVSDHGRGHGHREHRHGQLVAVSFRDPAPLLARPLTLFIDSLGDRLVRAKGWIHLAGEDRRGFLERAGVRTELRLAEPWQDDARETELVMIGEGLDEGAVRRGLWACRVAS